MDLLGYSDRLSVEAGDRISFMVSSKAASYDAAIVRLIQGDDNPAGPGFKEELIDSAVNGSYPGAEQRLPSGSYVRAPEAATLDDLESFTLQAWVQPTTASKGVQGLITKWSATTSAGYGLFIDDEGDLALWISSPSGEIRRVRTRRALRDGAWYFAAATFDATTGAAAVYQQPLTFWPRDPTAALQREQLDAGAPVRTDSPLLIAAYCDAAAPGRIGATGHYNGKIDRPSVFAAALAETDVARLADHDSPAELGAPLVASWDFALDIPTAVVTDVSPNALHAQAVNMPMRAATGHNWTSREIDYRNAPSEWGAIHFHDDDLEDAQWEVSFTLEIPQSMRSGIYAARLRAGESEDYLPFFVRPKGGVPAADILFLVPTVEYLAYGNEHVTWADPHFARLSGHDSLEDRLQEEDRFMDEHHLLSCYDIHADGSGNCYSSWLRPVLTMRPKYNMPQHDGPHNFNADLFIADWLETKGHAFDVSTDHDLHHEGAPMLERYRVVVTGTKPEYWTTPMVDALRGYLDHGGRLMYLGGNGIFGPPAGIDPTRPHAIEIRRGLSGTLSSTWRSAPGEHHLSSTGESGEAMPARGVNPQSLLGIGMGSAGHDAASGYRRRPGSFDARAAFIFEGIGDDEVIGDFGLIMGGAAGFEMDRFDVSLGSPPHALVVASSQGLHTPGYSALVEEAAPDLAQLKVSSDGTPNPNIRADVVFMEGPRGGAVFSVGSCCWAGSLPHNDYENNVSRITENVLTRFLSPEPFDSDAESPE